MRHKPCQDDSDAPELALAASEEAVCVAESKTVSAFCSSEL